MACLKTYRGIPIERTPRDLQSFPQKWTYLANVRGTVIMAYTQQSIKLQIGRMLNGLPPSDCDRCVYHMRATPISPYAACGKEMPCFLKPNGQCPWFEVRI